MKFREMRVKKHRACPVCGDHPTINAPIDYHQFCGVPQPNTSQPDAQTPWDVDPAELQRRQQSDASFTLLDVRQPHEYEICNLGGTLIPLDELADRVDEIDVGKEIIVHCKLGGRSAKAVQLLRERGFTRVFNLRGGIMAWADEIDPAMPKY